MWCGKKSTDVTVEPIEKVTPTVEKALNYAKAVGMDSENTKIAVIAATQGMDVAKQTMINEFTDSNGNFDYCATRLKYG